MKLLQFFMLIPFVLLLILILLLWCGTLIDAFHKGDGFLASILILVGWAGIAVIYFEHTLGEK
jgi:ABC-type dipeptide/oligopeptide/nickel transport system permease subunit